jgi:hypothetical protein
VRAFVRADDTRPGERLGGEPAKRAPTPAPATAPSERRRNAARVAGNARAAVSCNAPSTSTSMSVAAISSNVGSERTPLIVRILSASGSPQRPPRSRRDPLL